MFASCVVAGNGCCFHLDDPWMRSHYVQPWRVAEISLPSTIVGLWNCNNHYYTWCPPTSFPLFRTLPPGPSILQIKAHSFSGSLFHCELSNVHLHITENLALFPMEVAEQQMGGQVKGLTYLLREVILCIFLWNTWDERVFIDKLWNNKILY